MTHTASMMQMMVDMQGKMCQLKDQVHRMKRTHDVHSKQSSKDILELRKKVLTLDYVNYTHMNSRFDDMEEKAELIQKNVQQLKRKCDTRFYDMDKKSELIQKNVQQLKKKCESMDESICRQFDDTVDKLDYHEVLLKNQKWEYLASQPSEEYWDGVDDDDECEAAANFLHQIREHTEEMKYGTGENEGTIIIDSTTNLTYNHEFLPHWEEFADALGQHHHCLRYLSEDEENLPSTLRLAEMELPDTVLDLLSEALESTHFHILFLARNNFGQRGIEFALVYLERNYIMKELILEGNHIDSMMDVEHLCRIIKQHPSINTLALPECRGADVDGYEMLQTVMSAGKSKLKVVDLARNNISTGGDTFISDFLRDNPMMEKLNLHGNQLDDNDAIAIAGALKHNTNLRFLEVRNNNLSRKGWAALRKAEFDDTSLNSAADSNHTCAIVYPLIGGEVEGIDTTEMNGNPEFILPSNHEPQSKFDPMYVRQKKIYSVLSYRNRTGFNVGHFDDVPVELLPDMLSSIQRYSEYHISDPDVRQGLYDVNPLSLVFEMLSRWDKSISAFESISLLQQTDKSQNWMCCGVRLPAMKKQCDKCYGWRAGWRTWDCTK